MRIYRNSNIEVPEKNKPTSKITVHTNYRDVRAFKSHADPNQPFSKEQLDLRLNGLLSRLQIFYIPLDNKKKYLKFRTITQIAYYT